MAYEGEVLNACGITHADMKKVSVVAVSGDGPNLCGHLLLYSPNGGGYYFHVAGIRDYPRYMNDAGYRRYLKETGKRELRRRSLELPNPDGALTCLEGLLAEKWTWGVLPHNCVSFVEEAIKAGGGEWNSYGNCPALATADTVGERIGRFYQWMESGIYRTYGIPH